MGTLWGEGSLNRKKNNRLGDRKQNIIDQKIGEYIQFHS